MNELKLGLRDQGEAFAPGESIVGAAGWNFDRVPKSAEVRLFWRTEGKGTQDVTVVETQSFDAPQISEARPFQFTAPDSPYSFSGRLISLVWSLELVVEPGAVSTRLDIVIAPDRKEILLQPASHESA